MTEIMDHLIRGSNLVRYFPNVILPAILDTLVMVVGSAVLAIFFGILLGVVLILTDKDGLSPHPVIYAVLGRLTDIVRSFPMMILIVAIAPLTRMVIGTKVGVRAAIFAITIGSTPYATRMTENSLRTVDPKLVKAAKAFGASKLQIIFKVMMVEALPSLVSNFTIMLINMLNTTAMAGAVGAGGLGAVALTKGKQRFEHVNIFYVVELLIVLVLVIPGFGNTLYRRVK